MVAGPAFVHSLEVALIAGFALAAMVPGAPRVASASLTTAGLMLSSATLVHFFDGLIEVHFHFFVMIAVVSLYQSWAPYLLAVSFVLLHHGVLGTLAPAQVYNHSTALDRPFLFAAVHGSFVLAESIACLAYWRASEQAVAAERRERADAEAANAALARANSEISDLVGMLSHDLRTPLSVVNGFAALLQERWPDLDDEHRRDLLRRISAAGRHCSRCSTTPSASPRSTPTDCSRSRSRSGSTPLCATCYRCSPTH